VNRRSTVIAAAAVVALIGGGTGIALAVTSHSAQRPEAASTEVTRRSSSPVASSPVASSPAATPSASASKASEVPSASVPEPAAQQAPKSSTTSTPSRSSTTTSTPVAPTSPEIAFNATFPDGLTIGECITETVPSNWPSATVDVWSGDGWPVSYSVDGSGDYTGSTTVPVGTDTVCIVSTTDPNSPSDLATVTVTAQFQNPANFPAG
jgi:polysaccharide biosynthesis protein PslG